jgi:hypothetical protein
MTDQRETADRRDEGMSSIVENGSAGYARRSPIDIAALILMPLFANLVLASLTFTLLADTETLGPRPQALDPFPIASRPPAGAALPVGNVRELIARVESAGGIRYACTGPWTTRIGTSKWACRTRDSLVVIEGTDNLHVFLVEATWFGFDPTGSDLPFWGSSAHRSPGLARRSQEWIADHLGSKAEMSVGQVLIRVGGARGALTLTLSS